MGRQERWAKLPTLRHLTSHASQMTQRVHSSLGMTPIDCFCQHIYDAPEWADVVEAYDPEKERFYERDYAQDRLIRQLKTAKQNFDIGLSLRRA